MYSSMWDLLATRRVRPSNEGGGTSGVEAEGCEQERNVMRILRRG